MKSGYTIVYRLTQSQFDAGAADSLVGARIEIIDSNGQLTGKVYESGELNNPANEISRVKDYMYCYNTAATQSVTGNADVIFNTSIGRGNLALAGNKVTLKVGRTYKLSSGGEVFVTASTIHANISFNAAGLSMPNSSSDLYPGITVSEKLQYPPTTIATPTIDTAVGMYCFAIGGTVSVDRWWMLAEEL